MEIGRRLTASNEPEEMRRWDARRPDPSRWRLRFEKSRLGRGNTICPDTSSRSQSIAVLSRHQAGVRIGFPRSDIKLTFAGIRATTAWLGSPTECGTTSDRTETRPTADLGSRSRPASGSSRMTARDGGRALTSPIASEFESYVKRRVALLERSSVPTRPHRRRNCSAASRQLPGPYID
jgi:hypothetical protein